MIEGETVEAIAWPTITNIKSVAEPSLSLYVRKTDGDDGRRTLRFPLSEVDAVGVTHRAVLELGYAIDGNQAHQSVTLDALHGAEIKLVQWAMSYGLTVQFK